jgi:two-component system, NarL family, response regulator DevR
MPVRVLIVEDHLVVAEGLAALLDDEPDLCVVGRATTVADAIRGVDEHRPDVVLMDYRLPDGTGAEATAEIRRRHPRVAVLFLTRLEGDMVRMAAFEAGAAGYLNKCRAAADVVSALRKVAAGETLLSTEDLTELLSLRRTTMHLMDRLTRRELETLALMARGADNRRIAAELGLRYGTVRCHVRNLMTKMGAHSKVDAVARGMELGLIEPWPPAPSRGEGAAGRANSCPPPL